MPCTETIKAVVDVVEGAGDLAEKEANYTGRTSAVKVERCEEKSSRSDVMDNEDWIRIKGSKIHEKILKKWRNIRENCCEWRIRVSK
jgi:hypothetical protein